MCTIDLKSISIVTQLICLHIELTSFLGMNRKKKVFINKERKEHDDNLLLQQSYEVAVDSTQRLRIVTMEAFRPKYSQVMVMIMMITIISLYIKYSFGPFCSSATGWFLSDERYGCWRVTATGEIVDCAPKVHPEAAHIVKPQTGKMIASPQNGCGIALLCVEASC